MQRCISAECETLTWCLEKEKEKKQSHTRRASSPSVEELTLSVDDVPEDEGGAESFTRALGADSHEAVGVVGGVRVRRGDGQNAS